MKLSEVRRLLKETGRAVENNDIVYTIDEWYAIDRELLQLESSLAEAREEIEATREAHKVVMAEKCADDEVHCTCVPFLRDEIERLREFVRLATVEWTVLESAESEGVVRVEYPCAVHIKMKELVKDETLNLPTNG